MTESKLTRGISAAGASRHIVGIPWYQRGADPVPGSLRLAYSNRLLSLNSQLEALTGARAKMRIHYLMHASFETPGIIETWTRDRGHGFDGTLTYANEKPPAEADLDFLIVMGGPQTRMDDYP